MTAIQQRDSLALNEYRPQGMGHILKLCAITTAGIMLVSMGGSIIFAVPLALATIYGMFRGANKAQDPMWCESRDEIWHYKLSPKHRSISDDYPDWCKEWGTSLVNQLIEPMIGNCAIANFVKDKKHPYYGLRGVLVYDHDDDDLPPLCPWDYVNFRLQERLEVLKKQQQEVIDVKAKTIPLDAISPGRVAENPEATYQFLLSLTKAPLQPVIIAGQPGSGKGTLAAMALSLGVKENGLRFWVFNPKAKLLEAGYWVRAEKHYLKDRLQDDPDLFTDLMQVLEDFAAEAVRRNGQTCEHPPFVLLLEEVRAIVGLFTPKQKQLYSAKLIALVALIRGCNMALWLSGQSINLKDLGFDGESNRAMFTAIVAVGDERKSVNALCKPFGIQFDNEQLKQGDRYWLTSTCSYKALPCPQKIPLYEDWSQVKNLVDLRPQTLLNPTKKPTENSNFSHFSYGEISPSIGEPQANEPPSTSVKTSTNSNELEETERNIKTPSDAHRKLAKYLSQKRELPVRKIIQNWGSSNGFNADNVRELLIDLESVGLIEMFTPAGKNNEFARWVNTQHPTPNTQQ